MGWSEQMEQKKVHQRREGWSEQMGQRKVHQRREGWSGQMGQRKVHQRREGWSGQMGQRKVQQRGGVEGVAEGAAGGVESERIKQHCSHGTTANSLHA
jgi:hypothetical protein